MTTCLSRSLNRQPFGGLRGYTAAENASTDYWRTEDWRTESFDRPRTPRKRFSGGGRRARKEVRLPFPRRPQGRRTIKPRIKSPAQPGATTSPSAACPVLILSRARRHLRGHVRESPQIARTRRLLLVLRTRVTRTTTASSGTRLAPTRIGPNEYRSATAPVR